MAQQIIQALTPFTPFAHVIVQRQAERLGCAIESLTPEMLPRLLPNVEIVLRSMLDASEFTLVQHELRSLMRGTSAGPR